MSGTGNRCMEPEALAVYHPGERLADRARALLRQQQIHWPLAARGYAALAQIETRRISLQGLPVVLQYNPGRMASSSARVDEAAIQRRPCFLCPAHLPEPQRALAFGKDFLVLVNPFPIAPEHLTLPARRHTPQRLLPAFSVLLQMARELSPHFTLFYNGPRCGASAPDHLHFQAVPSDFMPLDREFPALVRRVGRAGPPLGPVRTTFLDACVCPCLSLESDHADALTEAVEDLLRALAHLLPGSASQEPMVNVLVRYQAGWRVVFIPRTRHRPSVYPGRDGKGILLSPASVDLAGVCITPREEDFRRLDADLLAEIFSQVCLGREGWDRLEQRLRSRP